VYFILPSGCCSTVASLIPGDASSHCMISLCDALNVALKLLVKLLPSTAIVTSSALTGNGANLPHSITSPNISAFLVESLLSWLLLDFGIDIKVARCGLQRYQTSHIVRAKACHAQPRPKIVSQARKIALIVEASKSLSVNRSNDRS